MGKVKVRLNGKKNAKRWKKGQSSSSNPTTHKYREQARTWFFQENIGSGLTTAQLKTHNAMQGSKATFDKPPAKSEASSEYRSMVTDDDDVSMGDTETVNTFNTFASEWSECSNVSFNRLLNRFEPNSAMHKEMLAVLAAVTEVIKQNGGTESPTEYYAALMTTLEAAEATEETVAAIISLLSMGIKAVPKNVLILQFSRASQLLLDVLTKYISLENFLIIRNCIGCLSWLLRVQESAAWSNSSTMRILEGVLTFTHHTKPKVRKAAQHAVCAILKGSDLMKTENPPPYHPASTRVAKYCLLQLENAGQPGGITSVLHTLTLLKDVIDRFPKAQVKIICENLLRIMGLNNVLVTSCCLQTLHGLFVSKPPETILPAELNAQIINALYDYQPAPGDTQPTLAWLAVLQEAMCNLQEKSLDLCAANLPRLLEKCIELWLSDKLQVVSGASNTIKALLQICVVPMCVDEGQVKRYTVCLNRTIQYIHQGLKYQYHLAWQHVFHLSAILFQICGSICSNQLSELLHDLSSLRESSEISYTAEIEYAIGAAVRSMGPEKILQIIPIEDEKDVIDLRRSWMLPILKDCITHGTLAYFRNRLLPLIRTCEQKAEAFKASGELANSHTYELLASQLWALLPSFCNNALDVSSSFKTIAQKLGENLQNKSDYRMSIMSALRKLITKAVQNNSENDVKELGVFAKNYLPILFNRYTLEPSGTNEEGQRLATIDTIKVYLTITPPRIIGELLDKALKKIEECTEVDEYAKRSLFDLLRVLLQFTDEGRLGILYEKCVRIIKLRSHREQKKAYRMLEEICASDREVCRKFVNDNFESIKQQFLETAKFVRANAKGPRLRCLTHIVKNATTGDTLMEFIGNILEEAVLGTKELNERCRLSSCDLLKAITEKLMDNAEFFEAFMNLLISGLSHSNEKLRSATLLALASILYTFNGSLGIQKANEILDQSCNLLTCDKRDIVLSALVCVKVYLSVLPSIVVAPLLQRIVEALSNMTEDCKQHFRRKVHDIFSKLIRKYGCETIIPIVPATEVILHKRLKNIVKSERRKKNREKQEKENNNDDNLAGEFDFKKKPKTIEEILEDSDEDIEDMETDEPRKGHKRTSRKDAWIRENEDNIVDFVDPTAAKNISATKPVAAAAAGSVESRTKSKTSHGFKTAPDGRLIIKDADDDDDDDETDEMSKKKRKKILPIGEGSVFDLDNEEEMDDEDDDEKSIISSHPLRKRKLSETASSYARSVSSYKTGGSGIHRPLKMTKTERAPGSEYKAKKAQGDVKKKGKPDPFAYLPLRRCVLNKRKQKKNAGQFNNLVSGAKKGARIGNRKRKP